MRSASLWEALGEWLGRRAEADRDAVTVTVTPAKAERTFQVQVPRWGVRLLLTLLIVAFLGLGAAVLGFGLFLRDRSNLAKMRAENRELRQRMGRIAELEEEIRQLDQARRQLYLLAGVPDDTEGFKEQGATEPDSMEAGRSGPLIDSAWDLTQMGKDSPLRFLPLRGPVSRGFTEGPGDDPEHGGVDIAGAVGTPVLAAASGKVVFAGWDPTFGNLLVLRHDRGWETRYGHSQRLLVSEGDSVRAGQRIAFVGNTGRSSAPHLHFETIWQQIAVNPARYFGVYRTDSDEDRIRN